MQHRVFRLACAVLALVFRGVYGYYAGIDFTQPNHTASAFILWSAVFAFLVYMVILPRQRSPERHPNQRSTDRQQ